MIRTPLRRAVVAAAAASALALTLAACSGAAEAGQSGGGVDAASATDVSAFGSFQALETAAKAEGALNVIALPRDWANYGEIIDAFKKKYPEIEVTEQSPDVSSAEEIQAATTNAGLDTAPDVFDLGLTVALQNTDKFAAYKVQTFDEIPDALKEPTGLFVGDYGGYMSVKMLEKTPGVYAAAGRSVVPGDVLELGCCFGFLSLRLAGADIGAHEGDEGRAEAEHQGDQEVF